MKTTLELPDELFRRSKLKALKRGITLKRFVTEALESKLVQDEKSTTEKPWMKSFGRLSHLRKENRRVDELIAEEFDSVDPETWQ